MANVMGAALRSLRREVVDAEEKLPPDAAVSDQHSASAVQYWLGGEAEAGEQGLEVALSTAMVKKHDGA